MKIAIHELPDKTFAGVLESDGLGAIAAEGGKLSEVLKNLSDLVSQRETYMPNENNTTEGVSVPTGLNSPSETDQQKVERVAAQINALLTMEGIAMVPSITLQIVPKPPAIEVPGAPTILTP